MTGQSIHGVIQGQTRKGRTYSKAGGDHVDATRQ